MRTERWVLGFDAGCTTCNGLARRIEDLAAGGLTVQGLRDPDVRAWRQQVFGAEASWTPTLFAVTDTTVRAWTGPGMIWRVVRLLGPGKAWHILRALATLPDPARRHFLKLVGGGVLSALALSTDMIAPPASVAAAGTSGPIGTWYVVANALRLTIVIADAGAGAYRGTLSGDGGGSGNLANITWDASSRLLEFQSGTQWYRGTIVQGVLVGRFSEKRAQAEKPPLTDYLYHLTGWNSNYLDGDIVPRVYEILADGVSMGRLRIDRAPGGAYTGRLKYYANSSMHPPAAGEELEYDLEITQWDGTHLGFVRRDAAWTETYTGQTNGRGIAGTYARSDRPGTFAWSGSRAEVLGYGLVSKSPAARAAWQDRTRQQLVHLMMADNPAPASVTVTTVQANQPPPSGTSVYNRDDDLQRWPKQPYRLTELQFDYTIPDPAGGPAMARRSHAWLALPNDLEAGVKRRAVLALNGHGSSGYNVMNPANWFWYGDSFARRGYIVLAPDLGHRPCGAPLYNGYWGDDVEDGNGPHPAITAPRYAPYASCTQPYSGMAYADTQSDWEENGERTWDAMRALDYLCSRPDVDPDTITVAGLSLGGEITTLLAALDHRVTVSVSAGYAPDMGVMLYNDIHPCWRWAHADIREYFDQSDFHALIAPRPLIIEIGKRDTGYTVLAAPFVGAKQVARRTYAAYGADVGNFVHYLHADFHCFHIGEAPLDPANPPAYYQAGVQVPTIFEPQAPWSLDWQTDGTTAPIQSSLFNYLPAPTALGWPPAIASLTPPSGSTHGGVAVTIVGTHFADGATVTFDGVAATLVQVVDAGTITAVTPGHKAASVRVVVTNPDGQRASIDNAFTYVVPAPANPAIDPSRPGSPVAAPPPRTQPGVTGVAPGATPNPAPPRR